MFRVVCGPIPEKEVSLDVIRERVLRYSLFLTTYLLLYAHTLDSYRVVQMPWPFLFLYNVLCLEFWLWQESVIRKFKSTADSEMEIYKSVLIAVSAVRSITSSLDSRETTTCGSDLLLSRR